LEEVKTHEVMVNGTMVSILIKYKFILYTDTDTDCASTFVFEKGRGTCGSGERNVNIWIDFLKSPRFSLTHFALKSRQRE
jgi:hypothetical protein